MRRPGIILTIAIAWTAVVVGHLIAYLLTYPSQGLRHLHLVVTGHSWTGMATASLLAAVPVILLAIAVGSLRTAASWPGRALALRLTAIQAPAFLTLEIMERGWSAERAVSDPAVLVGLALQPLVAVIAAWVLELVRRTVRAIASLLLRAPLAQAPRSLPRPGLLFATPRSWRFLPGRRRAPPVTDCP